MKILCTALLLAALSFPAAAEEGSPITIGLEPLGDTDSGQIVTRVTFRFANAPEVPPETGLLLQGSFMQAGQVLRNFRYQVRPDQRGAVSAVQSFAAGDAVVDVRLLMPVDEGAPVIVAKSTATFPVAKTGNPYVASGQDGAEAVLAEGIVPESVGAVKILPPQRDVAPNLFIVNVDVQPPVRRVEFWVDGKKVLARNAAPYRAELDLGSIPKRVEVRAIGYDNAGRYVDADAFIVNEREGQLEVKITQTTTPDGVSHFKLSVQNPKNTNLKTVALFAGDRKLYEWTQPPYALDLPTARLKGQEFVRASVVDETGYEAADLLFLDGQRFMESIEVNLVELPVTVTGPDGTPITGLVEKNFTVLENGAPQRLSSFDFAANLPISVGVLLDHSGSMEKRMSDAKDAARQFFRSILRKNDRAFIGAFANDPARNAPFVSVLQTLEAQIDAIPDAGGGTSLYDAIVTGLYRFRNLQGRKALIIISDGEDTTSRLTYDDMLNYARASRVPLYFVGIGIGMGGRGIMKSLAAETGGSAYFTKGTKDLPEAYAKLEADLRSQYLLSYHTETSSKDTAYRTVEVKVDRPDAKVRTIRGYIP